MGDRKRKFSHALELDAQGAIALLEGVIEGLRVGELQLEGGEQVLRLRPGGPIAAQVEGRGKSKGESLRIELSWTAAAAEPGLRVGARAATTRVLPLSAEPEPTRVSDEWPESPEQPESEPESPPISDERFEAEALAKLPRDRLRAIAREVALERRSQLSKRQLAEALSTRPIVAWLDEEELRQLRGA